MDIDFKLLITHLDNSYHKDVDSIILSICNSYKIVIFFFFKKEKNQLTLILIKKNIYTYF